MGSEIVDSFEKQRRESPDRALIYLPGPDAALTAADLAAAAEAVGGALDAAGVNPRGLIATAIGNRPGFLATLLACRRRNQPLMPLDAGTAPAEISAASLRFGAAAVLLAAPQVLDGHCRLSTTVLGLTLALPDRDPGDSRHGDAAVLKMTSGSSGSPRATLTPEAALVTDSRNLMHTMRVGRDDIQMAAIPLSHAYGLGNVAVPLFIQGTPVVMRDAFVPQRLPDDARRFGARAFPGVPFMFDHFAKNLAPGEWPPLLANLISAGAPLEGALAETFRSRFGVKIRPFYGTSETGGITFDAADEAASDGLVGTPLPGVTLTFVDQDGAPPGQGRVHVRSATVIRGYADGIDPDSFVDGGFLTGDLGSLDARGRLSLTGRVSSFVNVAGRKVQPDEVERVLRTLGGVTDVRVIGLADARRGEQLVACLVVSGEHPSILALRQFCGAQLASYKIPRLFVFLPEIPLTERGKTDRVRLHAAAVASLTPATGML